MIRLFTITFACIAVLALSSCGPAITDPVYGPKEPHWHLPVGNEIYVAMPGTDFSMTGNTLIQAIAKGVMLDLDSLTNTASLLVKIDSLPIGMNIGSTYGDESTLTAMTLATDTLRIKLDSLIVIPIGLLPGLPGNPQGGGTHCSVLVTHKDTMSKGVTETKIPADGVNAGVLLHVLRPSAEPNKVHLTLHYYFGNPSNFTEPNLVVKVIPRFW
ncbi:MAG: hypothetical protein JNL32_12445 [Candidatus Kapabacteria bacterium]|nr:hypothetical protein [Candidatus Kapabacteria bacterium]